MTESEIQTLILDTLNRQPDFFAWRNQSQGTYDPVRKIHRKKVGFDIKGVSDILGVYKPNGKIICIEVKELDAPPSSVSMEQTAFLNKIKNCNGYAAWMNNADQVHLFMKTIREDK